METAQKATVQFQTEHNLQTEAAAHTDAAAAATTVPSTAMQHPTPATDRKMQYRHQTASLHRADLHKAACTDALQRRIQDHP